MSEILESTEKFVNLPETNSYLNEEDYRKLAKKLSYNKKIEDIVDIIFETNPTIVRDLYTGQKTLYAKRLLELNKNCFIEIKGSNIFMKDTLRMIPTYLVQ